jgi:hypothetical protein
MSAQAQDIAARFCYAPVQGEKLPAPYCITPQEVRSACQDMQEEMRLLFLAVSKRGCFALSTDDGVLLADKNCIQRIACKTIEESKALAESLVAELTSAPGWRERAMAVPYGKHFQQCARIAEECFRAQGVEE